MLMNRTSFLQGLTHHFEDEHTNSKSLQGNKNESQIITAPEEVRKSLKRVKIGEACGPDNVNARVLKSCVDQLIYPLHTLQASMDQGKVTALWK